MQSFKGWLLLACCLSARGKEKIKKQIMGLAAVSISICSWSNTNERLCYKEGTAPQPSRSSCPELRNAVGAALARAPI